MTLSIMKYFLYNVSPMVEGHNDTQEIKELFLKHNVIYMRSP